MNREKILSEVASGLAKLHNGRDGAGGRDDGAPLWRVEVALFEEDRSLVAVAPLTLALGWIVSDLRQTEDLTDVSRAVEAHVQVREGDCTVCGRWKAHAEPETDESDDESDERDPLDEGDRGDGPIESEDLDAWAERHDELNGAPEGPEDR